jgi:hypothetical protein
MNRKEMDGMRSKNEKKINRCRQQNKRGASSKTGLWPILFVALVGLVLLLLISSSQASGIAQWFFLFLVVCVLCRVGLTSMVALMVHRSFGTKIHSAMVAAQALRFHRQGSRKSRRKAA